METWSQSETPPELQPAGGLRNVPSYSSNESPDLAELLLRILSRLTVYQSLPENPGLVLSVRDDVSMLDACCLLTPAQSSWSVIEVLDSISTSVPDSPSNRAGKLISLAQQRAEDPLFAKALEKEATRVTSAFATDAENIDPIGEFLSINDAFFFLIKSLKKEPKIDEMTVRDWIALKRAPITDNDSSDWIRFVETSALIRRAYLNLSQGVGHNQVISGSTMNLSSSNLIATDMAFAQKDSKSGGSCLQAVNELLDRPWQNALPLTVSTEKGISAVFGYTTLKQLMAHVAMNCSDRRLEHFFSASVEYSALRKDAETNLEAASFLDYDEANLKDAIEVLAANPISLLVSGKYQTFHIFVTPADVCDVLGQRLDLVSRAEPVKPLTAHKLSELQSTELDREASILRESDFPMVLSVLLQKLLMSKADAIAVLSDDDVPVGVVTCRDVWAYVMQGASPGAE